MNEAQRIAYLDAMDVSIYLPRARLIGAPEPRVYPVVDANPSQVAGSLSQDGRMPEDLPAISISDHHAAQAVTGNVAKLFGKLAGAAAEEPADLSTDTPTLPSDLDAAIDAAASRLKQSSTAPHVSFHLAVWFFDRFIIIDDYDPSAALPTQKLLTNILANGFSCHSDMPGGAETLKWPMAGFDSNDGWSAASEMVMEFLLNRVDSAEPLELLAFGEASGKVLLGEAYDSASACWKVLNDLPLKGIKRVYTFDSLQNILRQPLLKKRIQEMLIDSGE